MKPILVARRVGSVGAVSALFFLACGGNSETSSDDDSGGEAGEPSGTGGSNGGSTAKGGTAGTNGGTPATGGAPTGGTGGTGGEPPDGVCEDITACGGDPLGIWNVSENCTEVVLDLGAELGCESIPATGSAVVTGTFTFADGLMTQDTVQTVDVTMLIDDACAQTLVGLPNVTAADVCPLVSAQLMMDPDTPGTCAVAPGGCRCDVTQGPTPNVQADPYEVVGTQIIVTDSADGTTGALDFCQEGDELHLHADAVDLATATLGSLTILLARQ
jgi:hypothetical protein